LAAVDVPPLLDYPNHLARLAILAGVADPALAEFYAPRWAILPNLATDLLVPPLARLVPVDVAGRIALAAILLLTLAGMVAYHRAAFGVRRHWPIAGALVCTHALFLLGFMNFSAGLGLALLLAAAWIAWRETRPALALAVCAPGVAALFFCHAFGVLFFAVLAGSQEAARLLAERRAAAVLRRGAALALVLAPAVLLYALSPLSAAAGETCHVGALRKAINLAEPVMNYHGVLDALTGLAILGVAALGLRRGAVHPGSALAAALLLAAYLVAPFTAKGAGFVDTRFPVMLGLLLFAGLDPRLPRRVAPIAAAVLALLVPLRAAAVAQAWTAHEADLAALRASIAAVEPGSRVLVATAQADATPAYWRDGPRSRTVTRFAPTGQHLGALLPLERGAFMPLLFSEPSQQPLAVRPPFDRLSARSSVPPDWRLLTRDAWHADELELGPYLPGWQRSFDHVLVLMADAAPGLRAAVAERLEPVNAIGPFALFRVRADAPAGMVSILPRRPPRCGFM
jgi:PIN domain nuclease of toxin-antitoxin system